MEISCISLILHPSRLVSVCLISKQQSYLFLIVVPDIYHTEEQMMEPGTWIDSTGGAHEHDGSPRSNRTDV